MKHIVLVRFGAFAAAILFTLLSFFHFLPNIYSAQEIPEKKYYGIILEPGIVYIELSPSETFEGSIDLTNDFQHLQTVEYTPLPVYFKQDGETGNPMLIFDTDRRDEFDASNWVNVQESDYTLAYGETQASNYTVTVPEYTTAGGYYAAITYTEKSAESPEDAIGLNKGVAALLFITVRAPGGVLENGELLEFKTNKKWYSFTPVDFTIRYQNTGNIHTTIGGNIFIHRGDPTKTKDILTVNSSNGLTLPDSIRTYKERFENGFITLVDGRPHFNFDNFPKVYFGKYTATLKLKNTVSNERITTEKNVEFWIIPWPLIILLLGILAVPGGYLYYKKSKMMKR